MDYGADMGYLTMDTVWRDGLMFGPYQSLYFFAYLPLTLLLPLALIARGLNTARLLIASVFVIAGGYLGRFLFVYGQPHGLDDADIPG